MRAIFFAGMARSYRGDYLPSSRTSESRVISLMDLAPVSTMATRISFSIRSVTISRIVVSHCATWILAR